MYALVAALLVSAPARAAEACECSRTTTLADRVADAATIVEGAIVGVGPMVPNMAPLEERRKTGVSEIQSFRLQVSAVLKPGSGVAEGGELDVTFQHCNTAPLSPRTGESRIHYLRVDPATGRLTTHFCDWFKANRDTREVILAAVAAGAPPPAPTPEVAPAVVTP